MKKKILSILLVLSMMVGMLSIMPISIGAAELAGAGTEGDPYLIESVEDWNTFATDYANGSTAYVKVTAEELDFNGTAPKQINKFKGTLDGNGVVIKNVNMSGKDDIGLICTSSGTYKNFVITQSSFSVTNQWVGSLICCTNNDTTIENVYVSGSVSVTSTKDGGNAYAGGILGGFGSKNTEYTVTFNDCVFEGTVNAPGNSKNCGGLFGGMQKGDNGGVHSTEIKNCLVTGALYGGRSPSSGFIGFAEDCSVSFENCIYAGGAEEDYFWSFPFSQKLREISVINCYTTYVCNGGGVYKDADNVTVKYSDPNSGVTYINEGEALANDGKHFADPDFNPNGKLIGLDAEITVEGFTKRDGEIMVPDGVANFKLKDEVVALRGEGTYGSPYLIGSAEEWDIFYTLSKQGNDFDGEYVELDASIDFDGATLHPVFCEMCGSKKGFKGSFDGRGYTLSNFTVDSQEDSASLFGVLDGGAVVENLVVSNATIAVKDYGAVIAGGIRNDDNTIRNIYVASDVVVTGERYLGGIVGSTYSSATGLNVNNCIFAGSINASKDYIGGIIGAGRDVTVSYCMNTGRVSGSTNVAGIATAEQKLTVYNCINTGSISAGGSYYGDIYAGNPKESGVAVYDCYYVDTLMRINTAGGGSASEYDNVKAELTDLIGVNASVPNGFDTRVGDLPVPSDCTVAPSQLLTLSLFDGASVRLDTSAANTTGLRFKAILGEAFLGNYSGNVTFGIIIAPTDYIVEADGVFTVDALNALSHGTNYILGQADKLMSGGEGEGYYVFSAVLTKVQEYNYTREFSARAYIAVDGDIVYYSNYDSAANSRSIAYVAEKAYNDTSATKSDAYKYEIAPNAGVYSPYGAAQRALLPAFFNKVATNIYLMSYNIRNIEGGDSLLNDPLTYEKDGRDQAVVDYILSEMPDVLGLQEVSVKTHAHYSDRTLSWFDTLVQLEARGYAYYKGENILPADDNKEMYNPIYYKADKYELVGSGFGYLSADGTQTEYSGEYRGVAYVVLKDKTTGEQFVYVNVHMTRKVSTDNYQDDVAGYLMNFVEGLKSEYTCPIFIGGDFNGSYSDYKDYCLDGENNPYWGSTAIIARDKATNKSAGCSTVDNFDTLGTSSGTIDLYYMLNRTNITVHNFAVTDNKVESTGLYPSDHLPVKLVVSILNDKTN